MTKNLVVCCDGTGNEIEEDQSNVLKLYRVLKKSAEQRVFYEPGIGTMGADNQWTRLKQGVEKIAGLALGYGLDRDVLNAYEFLVKNYMPGDAIFLFGFSRGAYTARVLAGFINTLGLLTPDQINLNGFAFVAYKKISETDDFKPIRVFEQALRPQRPPIRFLGLWDTVSSIIVPRRDRLYLPSLTQLAYTATNPSVETVRHAIALDERRRMFRAYHWAPEQEYCGGPFRQAKVKAQDCKELWFPGVHSDIGGGYEEAQSGLSKIALKWMIEESPSELQYVTQSANQIVLGNPRAGSAQHYARPDPTAALHESLTRGWWPLEWLPKRLKYRQDKSRRGFLGCYLPRGERRGIPEDATIHSSVAERMARDNTYRPENLPK